jgi:aryl-alcohol dehydrogenase-like predicted oxidoreductase
VQVGYSLLHQDDGDRIARARDKGIGVLIRSGFAGGWLSPRVLTVPAEQRPPKSQKLLELCVGDADQLDALALHFLARHAGVSSILVGTKSAANLRRAMELIERPADGSLLERAARLSLTG